MLILVGFAPKSELWQKGMPISLPTATNSAMPGYGRHAPRLFGPFILIVLTANYGNRYAHRRGQVQVKVDRF